MGKVAHVAVRIVEASSLEIVGLVVWGLAVHRKDDTFKNAFKISKAVS